MPTLIIRGSDGTEQRVELSEELSVGREAGNGLVLSDKGVSRRHCRFFVDEQGKLCVEDLGSSNGVFVDGERIERPTEIRPGAEVRIGGATARLGARPASKDARPSAALARKSSPLAPQRSSALAKEVPARASRALAPKPVSKPAAKAPAKAPAKAGRKVEDCLEGQGALSGVVFELVGSTMLVGRVAPADIVIDDDSVSRRHAEIVRARKSAVVKDLGSANGTFLNGERVTEAPLSPGDVLQFGVIELRYAGAAASGMDPARRKKLLLAGAAAGVLLTLGGVLYLAENGGEPAVAPSTLMVPQGPSAEAAQPKDPLRELSRCKAVADPESDQLDWRKAIEVCGRVLKLDQTLTEARELELRAKHEVEYEELLKDAKVRLSTSQEEMALGALVRIPAASTSFNQARLAFKEAAERLFKRSLSACKTDLAARYYSSAAKKCQKAVDVTCNRASGADPEAKRLFEQAARAAGGRPLAPCPPEYKIFEPKGADNTLEQDAERLIGARYPDGPIRELMIKYFHSGKPRQISDELKRLRAKTARRLPQIDDYIVQLELVDGRYASGQEGLRRNQPELAWEFWKDAFDADAKLMPTGVRSFMIREMSSQLAALDYRLGKELERAGRYREASKFVFDGFKFDKTNTDIILTIANWEILAKRMMDAQPDCYAAQSALDVTLPESSVHKRAEQLRGELSCP